MHPEKSRLVRFRRPRRGRLPKQDGGRVPRPGTFDFLGFTHYLVHRQERQLGAQAKDGQGPPSAQSAGPQSLVRHAPPRVGRRAASDAGVEAAWALCLLRAYGERPDPVVVQLSRRPHLAEVAQPSVTEAGDAVDTVPSSPGPLPASADDSEPLGHPSVANPPVEEPDAEEPARPDLWGGQGQQRPWSTRPATTAEYGRGTVYGLTSGYRSVSVLRAGVARRARAARTSWRDIARKRPATNHASIAVPEPCPDHSFDFYRCSKTGVVWSMACPRAGREAARR